MKTAALRVLTVERLCLLGQHQQQETKQHKGQGSHLMHAANTITGGAAVLMLSESLCWLSYMVLS
jgi:histone acetyltransferase (RNA polymerase elongator complex component)